MFCLFPLYFKLKQIAEQFEMHKNIVDQQRRSFNEKRIEIQPDELMIVVDFKENIRLGGGPEECGQDYFTRQQCSVLGMAVVYWNQVIKQPSVEYIDFFSDILSHDALFVSSCIGNVLHNFINRKFRNLNLKKVHFWNDTGRHFQCGELAHYLLKVVPVEYNIQVTWNFFGEHHGKSIVDGHFGMLSKLIKDIENWHQVRTMDDLIFLLRQKERQIKEPQVGEQVMWHFNNYDRISRPNIIELLQIKNMCDFYYFESCILDNNICLRAKFLTSSGAYLENLQFSEKSVEETRKTKRGSDFADRQQKRKRQVEDDDEIDEVFGPIVRKRIRRQQQISSTN